MGITVDIKKKYGDFCLDIHFQGNSKRIGILGASGCGKSMTLKSIAGIETPDQGIIRLDDQVLYDSEKKINLKPQKRNIGYLFQNYALFPTMTVEKNIMAGLRGSKEANKARAQEMIEKFELHGLADRLPGQLSGGQQQRVALARIMAYEPDVILLDEPFSALDVFLKDRLQQELMRLLEDYEGTIIMVSHSRDEIYRFSEELLIMNQGKPVIYGATEDIFANPEYHEAAKLTGCKNFSKAERVDEHHVKLLDWGITLHTEREIPEGIGCVGYRAHDFVPIWGERTENSFAVRVESEAHLPFEKNYYLYPEGSEDLQMQTICWFVQRESLEKIEQQGLPDYLKLREEKMLFLK